MEKNAELLDVKAGSTYNYYLAIKGKTYTNLEKMFQTNVADPMSSTIS
jgi:hypothetical protein